MPVYLGDAAQLRSLLPHPKAAIFVHDYNGDYDKLVQYLNYLTTNETAYEEHRNWRHTFTYQKNIANKPILQNSWFCRVCQWAVTAVANSTHLDRNTNNSSTASGHGHQRKRTHICPNTTANAIPIKAPGDWENKAVRGAGSRQIYVVQKGVLRGVPDMDTFIAMGLQLEKVMVVGDKEIEALLVGDPLPRILT